MAGCGALVRLYVLVGAFMFGEVAYWCAAVLSQEVARFEGRDGSDV